MEKQLIKSKARVKNHGEVFTPQKIVDFMLNQPEIQEKLQSLTATFLEPAAGEGAFLLEILRRKMQLALNLSETATEYEENILIALTSLYGIELLEDNCRQLRMNMLYEFHSSYGKNIMQKFSAKINSKIIRSAKVIIRANIVQGDALKYTNNKNEPIIFSEWTVLPIKYGIRKIQRTEYTLEDILNENQPIEKSLPNQIEEFNLFSEFSEEHSQPKNIKYLPTKIIDIYQQVLENL
ncbi:N-6 DNA methylase [Megamonas hypermegale]|uniref:N-6 DNA methylase n=1 Tax=Megamonas hypermegale TaxID=158847 RepID=UPI0026EA9A3F|nr:N-6 DNA methylase [Megamonas hypermegale]